MLHGLYWLAANVAFEQPTLLAIDDLHWSDTPSLRWLCYLARRLEGLPLSVTVAMRPPEQGAIPELLTELLEPIPSRPDPPGPLAVDSITALVRRRFDDEPRAAFCRPRRGGDARQPAVRDGAARHRRREGIEPRADQAHCCSSSGRASSAVPSRCGSHACPSRRRALLEAACDSRRRDGAAARSPRLAGSTLAGAARASRELVRSGPADPRRPGRVLPPGRPHRDLRGARPLARGVTPPARRRDPPRRRLACPSRPAAHLLVDRAPRPVRRRRRFAPPRQLARAGRRRRPRSSYLTRALEESPTAPSAARCSIELGLAERCSIERRRRSPAPRGSRCSTTPCAVRRSRSSSAASSSTQTGWPRRSRCIGGLREIDAAEHPDLHERLEAEVAASAWW
jgi:hypothetical protein